MIWVSDDLQLALIVLISSFFFFLKEKQYLLKALKIM